MTEAVTFLASDRSSELTRRIALNRFTETGMLILLFIYFIIIVCPVPTGEGSGPQNFFKFLFFFSRNGDVF